MSKTSSITSYKRKLISSIVNSPELITIINPDYIDASGNCINVTDEEVGLLFKQIFPFYYVPNAQTEKLSYLAMKVNGLGTFNKIYTKAEIYIWVISHQDILRIDNSIDTRIDLMSEIIEDLFNGRDDFGFGEMKLTSNTETRINDSYRCRKLIFIVEDFHAKNCPDE